MASPNSFRDPYWSNLASKAEQKYDITPGLLVSVLTNGERSNANQKSEVGASTVFQITPPTRDLILKRDGIDAYLNDENAAEAAALVLKDGVNWAKGRAKDPIDADRLASGYYHAGGDTANWGPKTNAYINRVMVGQQGAKASELDSGFAKFMAANPAVPAGRSADAGTPTAAPVDKKTDALSEGFGRFLQREYGSKVSIPGAEASDARPPAADPTIGERIVGAGETALNLGTGFAAGAVAPVVGLADAFTNPTAGSLQTASDKAGQFAQDNTFAPRSSVGQDMAAATGNALANAIPLAGLTGEMGALARAGQVARPTAQAIPAVARNAVGTAAENVAAGVRAIPERVGQVLEGVPGVEVRGTSASRPTPGTFGSAGAAGVDMATQRRMAAQELPVPLDITEGMATRNYGQQRFEKETAKDPTLGAPLRERVQELNQGILRNFDAMVDLTGAESPDLRTTGTVVTQALRDQLARDKTKVRVAYKAAEKAGDMEAPVTLGSFVEHLNENAPDAAVAPLLDAARKRALQLGIAAEGPDGALVAQPVTLKTAETARRAISNATGFDPTNVYHGTLLKQSIDSATDGLGGNLYRAARAERARMAENYQNHAAISDLIGTKRGTGDRQVAVENVFGRAILNGSVDDIRQVRRVLQRSGEQGQQAWKELQGQTIKHIRDQATSSANDAVGNQTVSSHALNKTVTKLDDTGKLDFIFGKKGAETVRTLNDVVNSIRTSPEGAVNHSNTASVLAVLDMALIAGSGGGVPLPVMSGLRIAVNNIKDRRIRARVAEALGDAKRTERAAPKPIEGVAKKRTVH